MEQQEQQQEAGSAASEQPAPTAGEAVAKQIPEELKAQLQAIPRPVAIKYTLDGEVVVLGKPHPDDPKKMLVHDLPLKVVETSILPPNWTSRHDFIMGIVHEAVMQIKNNMPKRQVPVTRNELSTFGVEKHELAKMVKWGFLAERTITLHRQGEHDKNKGTPMGCAVVYFTPVGRAYIRKALNPSYGLPKEPSHEQEAAGSQCAGAGEGCAKPDQADGEVSGPGPSEDGPQL